MEDFSFVVDTVPVDDKNPVVLLLYSPLLHWLVVNRLELSFTELLIENYPCKRY